MEDIGGSTAHFCSMKIKKVKIDRELSLGLFHHRDPPEVLNKYKKEQE